MTTTSSAPRSALRTGLSAGSAFAGGVALGLLLALVLGGGCFFYYLSRLDGPGNVAARAGGAGAAIALLTSPPLLIAMALLFMMPLYVFVGMQLGRARAVARVVKNHGDTFAQRLAQTLAARIEAMPRAHGALHKTADVLSMREIMAQVTPWTGGGRITRTLVRFVLDRLPLASVLQQWQETRAEHGTQAQADDPALRNLLGRQIHQAMEDLAAPSYTWVWGAIAIHAVLLGVGIWLTA